MSGQVTAQGAKLGLILGVLTMHTVATVVPIFRGWIKATEKSIALAGLERQDSMAIAYKKKVQEW